MVAAFQRRATRPAKVLIDAGANLNALDHQSYDVITIAAVLDDLAMLKLAIARAGTRARSPSPTAAPR